MIHHVEYLECCVDGDPMLCVRIAKHGGLWALYDAGSYVNAWQYKHWLTHGASTERRYSWQYKTVRYRDATESRRVGTAVHSV